MEYLIFYSKIPPKRPLEIKTTLAIETTCFNIKMQTPVHYKDHFRQWDFTEFNTQISLGYSI